MDKAEILAEINRLAQILAERENPAAPAIRTVKVGNLEWQADVPDEKFTWSDANAYAASLGDGWRLPTIKELLSLVDYDRRGPACSVFPDCPCDWYWSSSVFSGGTTTAWYVYFGNGFAYANVVSSMYRVRCVRSVEGES